MPKVSVVMGVYNCEKTLAASVDSILTQTFQDVELILCDDGSKDKSYQIMQDYALKYPGKFKLLQNETNQGLARSLNRGIEAASGEYIARMDADDISLPERLEKQVAFLNAHPDFDMVSCCYYVFDDESVWGQRTLPEYPQKKDFLWTSPFCHACIVYRASSLEKVNGYRCEKATLRCEDYDLFMRMYAAGMKGYNLQEPLFKVYEGRQAYQRRKYKFRLDEAKIRYQGFRKLGLMPRGWPYVIKPFLVGLIPQNMLIKLRRNTKELEEKQRLD